MIRMLRSLPDPAALAGHLGTAYGVPFTRCVLRRSLVNDVYELASPAGAFVLKLYAADRWSVAEVEWEVALTARLEQQGLPVPAVRPLADGSVVGVLAAPEGDRPYVLGVHVAGDKPQPPFTDELYRSFGTLIGRFHTATDDFSPAEPRRPADLARDLDAPLAELLPLLEPADADRLRALAAAVHDRTGPAVGRGICHGDVSLDNILLTGAGLNLHDFDLSRPGYRATDFTGVAQTPHWEAFQQGYAEVRPLRPEDLAAVPWLAVAGSISNLHFHLVRKAALRGTEFRSEGWADAELASLRAAASHLL